MQIAWQQVECQQCHKRYQCVPEQDYYHAPGTPQEQRTTTNGLCETCLLLGAGIHPDNIVTSTDT